MAILPLGDTTQAVPGRLAILLIVGQVGHGCLFQLRHNRVRGLAWSCDFRWDLAERR